MGCSKMENEKRLLDDFKSEIMSKFIELCRGNDYNKLTLLRIGETIDRIYEKYRLLPTVDAVKHEGCKWCNGEYHTTILATAIRHHSNGNMDGYEMKVNYCPDCGATMDGDGNG